VVVPGAEEKAIAGVLDDWHDAAAKADEDRYFRYLSEDAVFLGTDATERWDKKAFRAYAHPHFAKGKAWSFHAVRRAIVIAPAGDFAWFDEDLATERLGPARGSGTLVKQGEDWRIAQYNLSIPIPNERFDAVKKIIAGETAAPPATDPAAGDPCAKPAPGTLCGTVMFDGEAPVMKVPAKRKDAEICKLDEVKHDAVLVQHGRLQDVVVRIVSGVKTAAPRASSPAVAVYQRRCTYSPRVTAVVVDETVSFRNDDATLHNIHAYKGKESLFNQAQPKGSPAIDKVFDEEGIVRLADDVHPWMAGFVVVTPNRYFAITGENGTVGIPGLPPGTYDVEAWHSIYGSKRATVVVNDHESATVTFTYTGKEKLAPENPRAAEELKSFR
jgi:plastocyanin